MIYTVFILLALFIVLIAFKTGNIHKYLLCIMIFGLLVTTSADIMQMIKMWNYTMPEAWFMKPDFIMYRYLYGININQYALARICNAGAAIYSLGQLAWNLKELRQMKMKKTAYAVSAGYIIMIVLFCIFYDPLIKYRCYIKAASGSDDAVLHMLMAIDYSAVTLQCLCYAMTTLIFAKRCKTTQIKQIHHRTLFFLCIVTALNILYCVMFVFGILRVPYMGDFSAERFFNLYYHNFRGGMLMTSFLVCCITIIILFMVMFKNGTFNSVDIFKRENEQKDKNDIPEEIRNTFHSMKNIFFDISLIAERVKTETSPEDAEQNAEKISMICNNAIDSIFKIMDVNNVRCDENRYNLIEIMDEAAGEIFVPEGITVKKDYSDSEVWIYCDNRLIKEVFKNILRNAIEAIQIADRTDGEIVLKQICEERYVSVNITDNGCGVREPAKVFRLLYTTKSRNKNWGMGMYYCKKIIHEHFGSIEIKNAKPKGAVVNITLLKLGD